MSPKTTSSAEELTLFLTHGSGFADILDCTYYESMPSPPSIELPAAKPPVRRIVTARGLVQAGLAVVMLLILGLACKVATSFYQNTVPSTKLARPICKTNVCPLPRLESFGTRVDFVPSPQDACRQAAGTGKLAFIVHVSGYFEDPEFT
jgi:hypothetical protein